MSSEEQLQTWFIQLSDLIGGDLNDESSLEEGLTWFGDLDDSTLNEIWGLGKNNPSLEKFLSLGRDLMKDIQI